MTLGMELERVTIADGGKFEQLASRPCRLVYTGDGLGRYRPRHRKWSQIHILKHK